MVERKFTLAADVMTADPARIRNELIQLVGVDAVLCTDRGFRVRTTVEGGNAGKLNRGLLSALRRLEPSTNLRSVWTRNGKAEYFLNFDSRDYRESEREKDEGKSGAGV